MTNPAKNFSFFKARKAKYGFQATVDGETILDVCEFVRGVVGPADDSKWYIEMATGGYGKIATVKLYVHDADIGERLKLAIA